MSRAQRLEQSLQAAFEPKIIEITNESHLHAGPQGESHFKVALVSDFFIGMSRVRRHQAVYAAAQQELDTGLHALGLHLYSPSEWQALQHVPSSPACQGGE